MATPTPDAIEKARLKVSQAKAKLRDLESRASAINRKADARRKIILGGLMIDAMRSGDWPQSPNELMRRITRDHDLKAFEGWTPQK